MKRIVLASMAVLAVIAVIAIGGRTGYASDHDDGETDLKARALNLSDHFAFKSPGDPTKLSLIMYFNPRSLPGKQYTLSTKARYELHVSKVAARTTAPTGNDELPVPVRGRPGRRQRRADDHAHRVQGRHAAGHARPG